MRGFRSEGNTNSADLSWRVQLAGTNKNLSSFLLNEVSHAKTRQNINHGYSLCIFPSELQS